MTPLDYIAGFTCTEGQRAADMKQVAYTAAALILGLLLAYVMSRMAYTPSTKKKEVFYTVCAFVVLVAICVFYIGPFFYNSWGCDSLLRYIVT